MRFINIHNALMGGLYEVARCKYPLYIPPQIAGVLVQTHHVLAPRRTEWRNSALNPPPNSDQKMRDYHTYVLRNINND